MTGHKVAKQWDLRNCRKPSFLEWYPKVSLPHYFSTCATFYDFISFLRNPDIERFPQDLPIWEILCVSGRSCLGMRPRQQLGFALCDFEHHICSIFWGWYSLFVAGWYEQIGHLPSPLLSRYLLNLIPQISLYHLLANVQWFAHSSRKLSALSGPFLNTCSQ